MHQFPHQLWDSDSLSKRLYLSLESASNMLSNLQASGICAPHTEKKGYFVYAPAATELDELIEQLAVFYSSNLIEVTNMIHSRTQSGRLVHLFADAFKFNKDN